MIKTPIPRALGCHSWGCWQPPAPRCSLALGSRHFGGTVTQAWVTPLHLSTLLPREDSLATLAATCW